MYPIRRSCGCLDSAATRGLDYGVFRWPRKWTVGRDSYGQEKAGLLQEEANRAARRADEDDRADARGRPAGGRRSDGGPGGQGGKLLYKGVFVWNDEHGPHGARSEE